MNNIFQPETIDHFIRRIQQLTPDSQAQWGKMTVAQMLKHCAENEKINLGEVQHKRLWIGRILGKMVLRKILKKGAIIKKNQRTHPTLIISEETDFRQYQQQLIDTLKKYHTKDRSDYQKQVHPFYGKMSVEEWSGIACKHLDHHLRQFGV